MQMKMTQKTIPMKKTKYNTNIDEEFVTEHAKNVKKSDLNKLSKKQKRLNKILSLKVFVGQKQKFKLLLDLLKQYKKGNYKSIPWRSIASIIFTLLYVVNPLDLIPDVLPVVGYIDDLSVFMALMRLIEEDIKDFESWKTSELTKN